MAKRSTLEEIAAVKQQVEHGGFDTETSCQLCEGLKLPDIQAKRLRQVVGAVRNKQSHRASLLVILTEIERAVQLGAAA